MKLSPKTVVPSALLTAILALLTATFPGTATAATTVITGGVETISTTGAFLAGNSYGVDFTLSSAQQINALGFWDQGFNGLGTSSYTVGLWQTSSPAMPIALVTISNADALDPTLTVAGGQWRYETFPTLNLTSGTTYTMGFYTASDMSPADSLLLDYPTLMTPSSVSALNFYRKDPASSSLVFPPFWTAASNLYFAQVNARFVPEPGSAGLVVLGSLMLLGRRRKTKD